MLADTGAPDLDTPTLDVERPPSGAQPVSAGAPIELRHDPERALLVGVRIGKTPEYEARESLRELELLVMTAGAVPVVTITQRLNRRISATLIGPGKVAEIAARMAHGDIDIVVVDAELSARQVRNLERELDCRVIDRSEVILDIFADHAQTHQARVQVELAQLEYTAGRLRRMWTHLSRVEGGIGTRGPGEKQIETDRRLVQRRINELQQTLRAIEERKQREVGARAGQAFTVSLVGYTNAGKSSLLNTLTGADVDVGDQLFKTLDTRTRRWSLADGLEIPLSDTVGFIRNLPHRLVASFHATLEEAANAALLIHVVDASHPEAMLQVDAVERVLHELELLGRPRLTALNKADRLVDRSELARLQERCADHVLISAHTGEGLDELTGRVLDHVLAGCVRIEVSLPYGDARMSLIERDGMLLQREFTGEGVTLRGWLPRPAAERAGLAG